MKQKYLDIMDRAFGAYSAEMIAGYISRVEKEGITEHGFPRLTANLGILLSHGYRSGYEDTFRHMMDLCCGQMPWIRSKNGKKVGNEFSVREICFALLEAEKAGICDEKMSTGWRGQLGKINPYEAYTVIAKVPPERIGNWAQFAATSEVVREYAGIGAEHGFIDAQLASQILSFDENGMYRDPDEPVLYDLMTRLQMAMALEYGYSGKHRQTLEDNLMKASLPTLYMQSVTGEIAFGGRSNQFLFNEAALAAMCEYYAVRYSRLGDDKTAGRFRHAAGIAAGSLEEWLAMPRISHIKNRYAADSGYGCEKYAYFDKYMITLASNIYCAYLLADDGIAETDSDEPDAPYTYASGDCFHQLFLNSGSICAQFDWNANPHYDATGLGRIHFRGVPSALTLSVPFPSSGCSYRLDKDNPVPFGYCPGVYADTGMSYGSSRDVKCRITGHGTNDGGAFFEAEFTFPDGTVLIQRGEISRDCVTLTVRGSGSVCQMFPVLLTDGEDTADAVYSADTVRVGYRGYECVYGTDGHMKPLNTVFSNRNGRYSGWYAEGKGEVRLTVRAGKSKNNK